jgi:hypothetical protein
MMISRDVWDWNAAKVESDTPRFLAAIVASQLNLVTPRVYQWAKTPGAGARQADTILFSRADVTVAPYVTMAFT